MKNVLGDWDAWLIFLQMLKVNSGNSWHFRNSSCVNWVTMVKVMIGHDKCVSVQTDDGRSRK